MSFLERQLQQIASSKAPLPTKARASLLFDPKAAADVDRETIFELGLSGFQKLVSLDSQFNQFGETLFSTAMKSQDRMLLTAQENSVLDKNISLFLQLLSPYYLQKDSFNALEWLVRRFKINEMNVDAVLKCILPYHETPQFVKFCKILALDGKPMWQFLMPVQKSNVPLGRGTLVQNCLKDRALVAYILKMGSENRQLGIKNNTLSSFYACTLIEYFNSLKAVDDNHLRLLLPSLLEGLQSEDADFRSTMQMLLALLSKKLVFEQDILSQILVATTKNLQRGSLYMSLLCLLTVTQSQDCNELPSEVVVSLLDQRFMLVLLHTLTLIALGGDHESAVSTLVELLRNADLSRECVTEIVGKILLAVQDDESAIPYGTAVLGQIHSQRFKEIEEQMDKLLQGKKKNKKMYEIFAKIFSGTVSESFQPGNTTLYLSLQHAESKIRLLALQRLKEILQGDDLESKDDIKSFLGPVLLDRLNDTPEIVSFVLDINGLTGLVDKHQLIQGLVIVASNENFTIVEKKALDLILTIVEEEPTLQSESVKHVLFGSLFSAISSKDLKIASEWVTTLAKKYSLSKKLKELAGAFVPNSTLLERVSHVTEFLVSNSDSECNFEFYIAGSQSICSLMRVLSMLVLNRAIFLKKIQLESTSLYLSVLSGFISNPKFAEYHDSIPLDSLTTKDGLPTDIFMKKLLGKNLETLENCLYLSSLAGIITNIQKKAVAVWFEKTDAHSYENLAFKLFEAIQLVGSQFQKVLVEKLFQNHCKNVLEFCLAVSTIHQSPTIQISALKIANVYLKALLSNGQFKDLQLVIPSLLICLSNPEQDVRAEATSFLKDLHSIYKKIEKAEIYGLDTFYGEKTGKVHYLLKNSAASFVEQLHSRAEEMLSDEEYLMNNIHSIVTMNSGDKLKWKEDYIDFTLTNVLAFSHKPSQATLLSIFKSLDTPLLLKTLHPLLQSELSAIQQSPEKVNYNRSLIQNLVQLYYSLSTASLFGKKSGIYLNQYCQLFAKYDTDHQIEVCLLAIEGISSEWFDGLNIVHRQLIFSVLVDTLALGPAQLSLPIKKCLKEITLSASVMEPKLSQIASSLEDSESVKKTKAEGDRQQEKIYILIAFLEILQLLSIDNDSIQLVSGIVSLLGGLLNFSTETFTNIEYAKQLILSALSSIMKECPEASELTEETLRTDLIVQCIRFTDNPQTHNAALLLLAAIGKILPDIVLVNIMPVFTFMGANILRQDDNYSFHVVQQTLETILPSLLNSGEEDSLTYVKAILDIFVNALTHVPSHRRLRLFTILIKTLGANEYLGSLVVLLLSSQIIAADKQIISPGESVNVKKFSMELLHQFDLETQFTTLNSMVEIFGSTPNENSSQELPAVLDCSVLQTKTIRQIKIQLLKFVNHALNYTAERIGATDGSEADSEVHLNLIKNILQEIAATHKLDISDNSPSTAKYVSTIKDLLYENLNVANSLLSLPVFLDVTTKLLSVKDANIKKRAMNMLQERIKVIGSEEIVPEEFDVVTDKLCGLFTEEDEAGGMENKQHALITFAVLVTVIGQKSLEKYTEILKLIIGKHGLLSSQIEVYSSSMIALASFIRVLGTRTIPYLPKFVPTFLKYTETALKNVEDVDNIVSSHVVIKSGLACFDAFIETIPQFTSSYLVQFIAILTSNSLVTINSEPIQKSVAGLLTKIPTLIDHRILFPVVNKQIQSMIQSSSSSFIQGLNLLIEIISCTKQANLLEFAKDWFKLFITVFDFKKQVSYSETETIAVEQVLKTVFIRFTMKMNEKTFKPLFLKVVDWGLTKEAENKLFLFRLVDSLLENLKTIFVPYYGYIMDAAIAILEEILDTKDVGALWEPVLVSLTKCFTFDTNGFVNQSRFDKILKPLVDQIDLIGAHGQEYKEKMIEFVIPCIGQLAKAYHQEDAWKQLNKAALMKTRSPEASVRWVGLSVISELYLRLGEEMLVFFPETIPFLAELMEDEDPEVEQLCQDVCLQIQQYLGEPIQQYFTA
ncbi:HEAT repeat-containing protein 1 [Boothiomyces macroporosus]|uniref:U3 small nucleolar RNA-associated protein 10 n=1 Tax=Boothiomyces macroporosus TaxID=261099 RepID=A0AAD5Y5Y9_9FUNG|nr:HEAT repeat-containing protein 1 [Boothiomyces macroporosus]